MMVENYLSFGVYVREKFGEKVYKLPVDAGFSCPNLTGEKGRGGCVYCRNEAFKPFYLEESDSLEEQVHRGKEIFRNKGANKFLIYLQPHTNTYAPLAKLETIYEELLSYSEVVGLCLGTRPDCLGAEIVELLAGYAESGYEIWVEIGQQTIHESTLRRINRGHRFQEYKKSVTRIREHPQLKLCTHVIFGLPGETEAMMHQSIEKLINLGLDGIKFHHLQVIRGTPLARSYREGEYTPLAYETYRDLVSWSLKKLPSDVVVHRLIGEAPRELLLAPRWNKNKHEFLQEICSDLD